MLGQENFARISRTKSKHFTFFETLKWLKDWTEFFILKKAFPLWQGTFPKSFLLRLSIFMICFPISAVQRSKKWKKRHLRGNCRQSSSPKTAVCKDKEVIPSTERYRAQKWPKAPLELPMKTSQMAGSLIDAGANRSAAFSHETEPFFRPGTPTNLSREVGRSGR